MRDDGQRRRTGRPAGRAQGRERWHRLHFECLEGRLLLSGDSLLSTIESLPPALVSAVASAVGVDQSAPGNSGQAQADTAARDADSNAADHSQGVSGSASAPGLLHILDGLAKGSSSNTGTLGLLNLSLGNDLAFTSVGSNSPSQATGDLRAGVSASGSVLSSGSVALLLNLASFNAAPQVKGAVHAGAEVEIELAPGEAGSEDVVITTISGGGDGSYGWREGAIAQSLNLSAAKDARQSDDPHMPGSSAATLITAAANDVDGAPATQVAVPLLTSVSQPEVLGPAEGAHITDQLATQLPALARVAAAVIPAAMRGAADAMMTQPKTEAESSGDAEIPQAAPIEPAVAVLQAAANVLPAGLLAVVPGDLRAVDQALENLLDEIESIGGDLVDYAANSNTLQWATAGIGLAACVGGAWLRRRSRSSGDPREDDEDSASWMFTRMQGLSAGGD